MAAKTNGASCLHGTLTWVTGYPPQRASAVDFDVQRTHNFSATDRAQTRTQRSEEDKSGSPMMAAETNAGSMSETPLENPNSGVVIAGQVLCLLVPLAVWFAPLPLEPNTKHAIDYLGPAVLVVVVAKNLLIRMAPVAVDRQKPFFLAGS